MAGVSKTPRVVPRTGAAPTRGRDERRPAGELAALRRLAAEAELVDQLLEHIDQRRAEAVERRARLERRLAMMDDAARRENGTCLAAEAATLESLLTRLRAAAALARRFAQLRGAEAGALIEEAARSGGARSATNREPDSEAPEQVGALEEESARAGAA